MPIKREEIREGAVFVEDPSEEEVIVKEIKFSPGKAKREIYLESPERPGCGVWQDEDLFVSIHSKLPTQTKPSVQKKGFFARLSRLFRFR